MDKERISKERTGQMERAEKDRKKFFGKCLIIFAVIMLLCTVISRAADAMTIPKVTVEKPMVESLTYTLSGSGTIEATEKKTYLLPSGYLVESVVESGSSVKAGDALVHFQLEQLEEQQEERKAAVTEAELALKQAKLAQTPDAWIPSADAAAKELAAAQTAYNDANAAYQAAVAAGTDEASLAELRAKVSDTTAQITEAQSSLDEAQANDEVVRTNTAKSQQSAGYSVELAQQAVNAAQERLTEVENLIAQNGIIAAEVDGIFENTALSAGNVTSGDEFISIGTGGLRFRAYADASAQSKLVSGDAIVIKPGTGNSIEAAITTLLSSSDVSQSANGTDDTNAQGSESTTIIQVNLPEDMELMTGYADFTVQKTSDTAYEKVVSLTALHQDSKGYYCLGIRTKSTILGEEQVAERINVTVIDKDDDKAAVTGGFTEDTKVIAASERSINPGDRVRVIE